jgi:Ring finger domain
MKRVLFPQKLNKSLQGFDSCAICHNNTNCTEYGALSFCPHTFHFECIWQWAQRDTNCPICKQRFSKILKFTCASDIFIDEIKVKLKDFRLDEEDTEDDLDICVECLKPDEGLLQCYGMERTCNTMFHWKCMGYKQKPRGEVFCSDCFKTENIPISASQKVSKLLTPPKRQRVDQVKLKASGGRAAHTSRLPRAFAKALGAEETINCLNQIDPVKQPKSSDKNLDGYEQDFLFSLK